MGHIRWSARQVASDLDELHDILKQCDPIIEQSGVKVEEILNRPNLPGYMSQPISVVRYKVFYTQEGMLDRIRQIKTFIPDEPLNREETKFAGLVKAFGGDKDKAQLAIGLGLEPRGA